MDGDREYELTCAVARSRHLLRILDREHDAASMYKVVRAVRFELDTMAQLLPQSSPPKKQTRQHPVQPPLS